MKISRLPAHLLEANIRLLTLSVTLLEPACAQLCLLDIITGEYHTRKWLCESVYEIILFSDLCIQFSSTHAHTNVRGRRKREETEWHREIEVMNVLGFEMCEQLMQWHWERPAPIQQNALLPLLTPNVHHRCASVKLATLSLAQPAVSIVCMLNWLWQI